MKKNLFFAALAITALVSCSENDFVGDTPSPNSNNDVGAISFGTGFKAVTRAVEGKAAADSLKNNFVVEGIKTVKKSDQSADSLVEVFDNYNVNWVDNTADKTLSNTANWEYVGQSILSGKTAVHEQSIKYWDFAASQYDFWAYSVGGGGAEVISLDSVTHSVNTPVGAAYTITGNKDALSKVYISDLVTAYNPVQSVSGLASGVTAPVVMGNEVELRFRSLVTKVRIGLYETVPGHSVKDVKFYPSTTGTPTTTATLFASSEALPSFPANSTSTYTVSFPTVGKDNIGKSDYNKAHVTFATDGTKASSLEFGELSYGDEHKYETAGKYWLGINSTQPTWAVEDGATASAYSIVMPNESGSTLTLKVDYTLESTDGTHETITIHGATALVPSEFTQWKPNYAYTYLFKISDNTNGLSNTAVTEKVGLYPITLNAVVVGSQDGTQETITTVATPSITTYSVNSNVIANNEYTTNDSIYVMAMTNESNTPAVVTLTDKVALYEISKNNSAYAATEAEVLDALTTYTSYNSGNYEGRDSVKLDTIAGAIDLTVTKIVQVDGDTLNVTAGQAGLIDKAKLAAGKFYAIVLNTTTGTPTTEDKIVAVKPASGTDVTKYYATEACTDKATSTADGNTTYYDKYTVVSGATYGIKVIKIKASN
jgi:hypothetical protein